MTTIKIERYEPNYDNDCCVCGATPVVTMIQKGEVVFTTDMCGVCTWEESEAIDPDTWN